MRRLAGALPRIQRHDSSLANRKRSDFTSLPVRIVLRLVRNDSKSSLGRGQASERCRPCTSERPRSETHPCFSKKRDSFPSLFPSSSVSASSPPPSILLYLLHRSERESFPSMGAFCWREFGSFRNRGRAIGNGLVLDVHTLPERNHPGFTIDRIRSVGIPRTRSIARVQDRKGRRFTKRKEKKGTSPFDRYGSVSSKIAAEWEGRRDLFLSSWIVPHRRIASFGFDTNEAQRWNVRGFLRFAGSRSCSRR